MTSLLKEYFQRDTDPQNPRIQEELTVYLIPQKRKIIAAMLGDQKGIELPRGVFSDRTWKVLEKLIDGVRFERGELEGITLKPAERSIVLSWEDTANF